MKSPKFFICMVAAAILLTAAAELFFQSKVNAVAVTKTDTLIWQPVYKGEAGHMRPVLIPLDSLHSEIK